MKQLLIIVFFLLFLSIQAWADCAWVLVKEKSFPENQLADPYVSVMPHSYYEKKKECEEGKESTLTFEGMVVGQTRNMKLHWIEGKDDKGREAVYRFECIPSNVLSLYIRAERQ